MKTTISKQAAAVKPLAPQLDNPKWDSPGWRVVRNLWPDMSDRETMRTDWGDKTPQGLAGCIDNIAADFAGIDPDLYSSLKPEAIAELLKQRVDLLAALSDVLETCQAGVIHRSETGKPHWSAFDHMKEIARAAIAAAKGGGE